MPDKKASTKDSKTKQTKCKCGDDCQCCHKSVFPICFLACLMTALLVAFCFAVGIAAKIKYELGNDLVIRSAGQFYRETDGKDSDKIISITAVALIDYFASNQTGFIYATPSNCASCNSFSNRLAYVAREQEVTDSIFRYSMPAKTDEFDDYIGEVVVADETGPVLLYVRDGKIFDRLDETNGDLALSAFIAKYK